MGEMAVEPEEVTGLIRIRYIVALSPNCIKRICLAGGRGDTTINIDLAGGAGGIGAGAGMNVSFENFFPSFSVQLLILITINGS